MLDHLQSLQVLVVGEGVLVVVEGLGTVESMRLCHDGYIFIIICDKLGIISSCS